MRDAGTQYLNLDTRYSVGIRSFDEQHYHILVVIDKLFDAIDNKKEQIVISSILEDFITQIKNHFICEENLMSSIDYPAFSVHKIMHDTFIRKILLYRRDHLEGNISFASERVAFFRRWFKNHILETDKLYISFFNDHNIN
ncbi:MAG: bacteriohemerythrin [Bacteroidota bacterium]